MGVESMSTGATEAPKQESKQFDEQRIDHLLSLIKEEIKLGRLNPKRLENLFIRDDKPVERKSEGSYCGYDTVVELGGEIISIKGPGESLYKGMQVETVGDSKGFVNGNLKPGEMVTIIGFEDPEKDTVCVEVAHQNGTAALKLKEVKPKEIK